MTTLTALGLAGVVFFVVIAAAVGGLAFINAMSTAYRSPYDEDDAA
jgi:hypothetical protein